jgi:hypothetical protein
LFKGVGTEDALERRARLVRTLEELKIPAAD